MGQNSELLSFDWNGLKPCIIQNYFQDIYLVVFWLHHCHVQFPMKLVVNEESLWTHVSHGFAGIGDSDAHEKVCGLDEEANKVMIVLK